MEKLTTKIDALTTKSKKLKEQISELENQMALIARSQAEATKLRAEEKAAFDINSVEMEKGVKGVKLALKVLNEYYAQEDKAHGSADGAGQGIIGLLEVCESDFTKGLAEMKATEDSAVSEYKKFSNANEIEKAAKEQDAKYKNKEALGLDKEAAEINGDRTTVQTELDATNEYYTSVKARCIAKGKRVGSNLQKLHDEIAGLKEALAVIEGQAVLLQQTHKHKLLRGAHAY